MYVAALLLGLLLNLWAGLGALQAQGRFAQFSFDLPNVDDISLPGRPVLKPVLDAGELRTVVSAAATVGRLASRLDDVSATADILPPGLTVPVKLVLQANLPRLLAPDPPIPDFHALRLMDIFLASARDGTRIDDPTANVEVRVAIRAVDLARAGGDPSRLLLLRFDPGSKTWEDTYATVDGAELVAHATQLSAFAVGLVEHPVPPSGLLGLLDGFGPFASPTNNATPRPTQLPEGVVDPANGLPASGSAQPGVPLAAGIANMMPVLPPFLPSEGATPTPGAATAAPTAATAAATLVAPGAGSTDVTAAPPPGPETIGAGSPIPSSTASPTLTDLTDRTTRTPSAALPTAGVTSSLTATPIPVPTVAPTPGASATPPLRELLTPTATPTELLTPGPTPDLATPTDLPIATPTVTEVPTSTSTPTLAPTPTPSPTSVPTPTATPISGRVIDIANRRPPNGEVGKLFDDAATVRKYGPGDDVTVYVAILNGGPLDLTYTMSIDATSSSSLDTDQANGLQLRVDRCGATFTVCGQSVYGGRAVVSDVAMGGPDAVGSLGQRGVRPSTRDYLRLRVSLPPGAGNSLEDLQSVLRFAWTSTQAF